MIKTAEVKSGLLHIRWFSNNKTEWWAVLTQIKTLEGKNFNPKTKKWTAPDNPENEKKLRQAGFEIHRPDNIKGPSEEWKALSVPEDIAKKLWAFQVDALKFVKWRKGRALIGDDMGLGKTVEALSCLKAYDVPDPILIVCPASIKFQDQYREWMDRDKIEVLSGRTPHRLDSNWSYIINWDILSTKEKGSGAEIGWVTELLRLSPTMVIGDEIQAIGNSSANRTKAFKRLVRKARGFIGLSGTPVKTRPYQFFTALNLVDSETFPNRWKFYERYCDLKRNGFGWDYNGISNAEELHTLVRHVMIRRTKDEVLKDLPKKIYTVVPLEKKATRMEAVGDWVEQFIQIVPKLVVFGWYRETLDYLHDRFKKTSVLLYGGTSDRDRAGALKSFTTDPGTQLFFGNVVSGGVGIDGLQKVCNYAAFAELVDSPKDMEQAEDRLHRIGQTRPVNIYYLVSQDSDEYRRAKDLERKARRIDHVVDGQVKTSAGEVIRKSEGGNNEVK
jgi:SWI/SNF-related matrix-associated actin-dependent regulator 1 of chromatin subfamily A